MDNCTLTGADDSTGYEQLWELASRFPFVEWGILLSVTNAGKGRYPSLKWIQELVERLQQTQWPERPRFALHVCGRAAKDFIENNVAITKLAQPFDRIQVNILAEQFDIDALDSMVARNYPKPIITQYNASNEHLANRLRHHKNHMILFDSSGGRGIGPAYWPAPIEGVRCGYAGGLGPDNIEQQLVEIDQAAAGQSYWIDMEGQLRGTGDRFDLVRAENVLTKVATVISRHQINPWKDEASGGKQAVRQA